MHASGVHPTIAGVLLGMTVPARAIQPDEGPRTTRYARAVGPWSSAVALPVFAFFSAGVEIDDGSGAAAVLGQPVVVAIAVGLVIGKLVGVLGTTALVTRLTPLRLPDSIGMRDLVPVGFLAGIGFTVSLLITELSFPDTEHTDGAKAAILAGSALAAILAGATLRWDGRKARRADMNEDGRPDAGGPLIGDDEA
jgi:NhaA family Na+:H+ antiporter